MQIANGVHSLGDASGGRVRALLIDDGTSLTLIDTLLARDGRLVLDALSNSAESRRTYRDVIPSVSEALLRSSG